MEYRKIISFGKSSFVVSLPKAWVTQNKLKKGDLVCFDEMGSKLLVQPQNERGEEEEKEVVISVDGKSVSQIQRELIPAYINNVRTVNLIGKEIKDKAPQIEPIIQNLMALEIMEQSATKIVARDFLNMQEI